MFSVIEKILALLIIVSLAFLPFAMGNSGEHLKFKNVSMDFDGGNSTISIVVNNTEYFKIKFTKIYVGSLEKRFLGWGNLNNMKVSTESGNNDVMGKYIHTRMWKNTTIQRISPWMKEYYALVTIDFYIAQKNYEKKDMEIKNNTIRFNVKIDTNCPDDFIFLEQRIYAQKSNKSMDVFENKKGWKEINRMDNPTYHNFSRDRNGIIGFGENNIDFRYGWIYNNYLKTLYKYTDDELVFYFEYTNTKHIIQDPYITLPVPIFVEPLKEIENFLMDHILSLSTGVILSIFLVVSPKFLRRIRL